MSDVFRSFARLRPHFTREIGGSVNRGSVECLAWPDCVCMISSLPLSLSLLYKVDNYVNGKNGCEKFHGIPILALILVCLFFFRQTSVWLASNLISLGRHEKSGKNTCRGRYFVNGEREREWHTSRQTFLTSCHLRNIMPCQSRSRQSGLHSMFFVVAECFWVDTKIKVACLGFMPLSVEGEWTWNFWRQKQVVAELS